MNKTTKAILSLILAGTLTAAIPSKKAISRTNNSVNVQSTLEGSVEGFDKVIPASDPSINKYNPYVKALGDAMYFSKENVEVEIEPNLDSETRKIFDELLDGKINNGELTQGNYAGVFKDGDDYKLVVQFTAPVTGDDGKNYLGFFFGIKEIDKDTYERIKSSRDRDVDNELNKKFSKLYKSCEGVDISYNEMLSLINGLHGYVVNVDGGDFEEKLADLLSGLDWKIHNKRRRFSEKEVKRILEGLSDGILDFKSKTGSEFNRTPDKAYGVRYEAFKIVKWGSDYMIFLVKDDETRSKYGIKLLKLIANRKNYERVADLFKKGLQNLYSVFGTDLMLTQKHSDSYSTLSSLKL